MLMVQPSASSGSGKTPELAPPLLGSSCFCCCSAGFWVNLLRQLLTAELKLGTVAALFATVPRETPPETGQALASGRSFSLSGWELSWCEWKRGSNRAAKPFAKAREKTELSELSQESRHR